MEDIKKLEDVIDEPCDISRKLKSLEGKVVELTFESKRLNKIFSLKGKLEFVGPSWTKFEWFETDYPDLKEDYLLNTGRIRSVEEV